MIWLALGMAAVSLLLALLAHRRLALVRRRQREYSRYIPGLRATVLRLERQLAEEQAISALSRLGRKPEFQPRSFSHYGEDVFLWNLLGKKLDGTFIEAGAVDGVYLSNTYFLEAIGWRGVLVEPVPKMAGRCAEQRPASRVVNAALGATSGGTVRFHAVGDSPTYLALSYSVTNQEHQQAIAAKQVEPDTFEVALRRLSDIIDETTIADANGVIDLLSLDVEGAEIEALRGLDHERHRFRVILAEDLTEGRDRQVRQELQASGYRYITTLFTNDVFVHHTENDLLDRATLLLDRLRSPGSPADRSVLPQPMSL